MVAPGPNGPPFTDVGRLVVRCPDRPGIVAVLSGLMAEVGANITDSQQHSSDPSGGTFTLRLEFVLADLPARPAGPPHPPVGSRPSPIGRPAEPSSSAGSRSSRPDGGWSGGSPRPRTAPP